MTEPTDNFLILSFLINRMHNILTVLDNKNNIVKLIFF